MPTLLQYQFTIRDDWPYVKLLVYEGPRLIVQDRQQYDVAFPNFEVRLKNVLQSALQTITASHT